MWPRPATRLHSPAWSVSGRRRLAALLLVLLAHPGSHAADNPMALQGAELRSYPREQLQRSGARTVGEFLQQLGAAPFGSRRSADAIVHSATATVDLRGLGEARTLILLDGQPLPAAGALGAASNIEGWPLAAVERLEVLLRAAGSRHWGEAAGGVLNIVSRERVAAGEASVSVTEPTHGGGRARDASLVHGMAGEHSQLQLGVFFGEREAVRWQDVRGDDPLVSVVANNLSTAIQPFRPSDVYRPGGLLNHPRFGAVLPGPEACPGTVIALAPPRCLFDLAPFTEEEAAQRSLLFDARWHHRLQSGWQLRASLLARRHEVELGAAPAPTAPWPNLAVFLPSESPNHPAQRYPELGYASDPLFLRHRFAGLDPQRYVAREDMDRGTLALAGDVGGWALRADAVVAASDYRQTHHNVVDRDTAQALIASGEYDIYRPNAVSDAIAARLLRQDGRAGRATLQQVELQARPRGAFLGALPLDATISLGSGRESYRAGSTPAELASGADVLQGIPASGSRQRHHLGARGALPLASKLDVVVMARWEQVGRAPGRLARSLDLHWSPSSTWSWHAGIGRSHRPATLLDVTRQPVAAIDQLGYNDFCAPADCLLDVDTFLVANARLAPERIDESRLGLRWSPLPAMSVHSEFYAVRIADRHTLLSANRIALCLDGRAPCPGALRRLAPGTPLPQPGLGPAVLDVANVFDLLERPSIQQGLINSGSLSQRGAALRIDLDHHRASGDRLDLRIEIDHLLDLDESFAHTALDDFGLPRRRAWLQAGWQRGPFQLSFASDYIDGTLSFDATYQRRFGDLDGAGERLPSFTRHHLQVRWHVQHATSLSLGVRNLTDRNPPEGFSDFSLVQPLYDSFGRSPYLQVEHRF